MTNPLLADWTGPFGLPDFAAVRDEDFRPAFETAMEEARAEIDAIAGQDAAPGFANTIAALERAGRRLDRVAAIFFNLAGTDSNPGREEIQREIAPKLAAHRNETMMNRALFARIDALAKDRAGLDPEQDRVLTLYHEMFLRAGARLEGEGRARLGEIMQRLASLGTQFAQNVLADERDWEMPLSAQDLEGLPADVVAAAAQAAADRGREGHLVTLNRSLIVPFLQGCPRRELRERAFRAWAARGMAGETDNRAIIAETLKLREERARLLGYPDFATFKLEREMARTPDAVRDLLMAVWAPARARAEADAERLAALMRADGVNDDLRPWDWRYYAERLRRAEHEIDEAELKPYFTRDRMRAATFEVARRLFGLSFHPLDVELHHPEALAWEVRRGDRHMGIFVADDFARASKRSGAWCSGFRSQSKLGQSKPGQSKPGQSKPGQSKLDAEERPIVVNVCNFSRPPSGQPALLTFDDARTMFHEFGHALHALMSDVTHPMVSGTSVARDFVELPSQLYEHWLTTPEVLTGFALHARTGLPMPPDLLGRLLAAENFDQGFATVEYAASALVDLALHAGPAPGDPMAAQAAVLEGLGMPAAIAMRHASPHFLHVFAGDGYSSGYYSYMWSEVMDADAFAAFEEAGDPFDAETARKLSEHVYSAGGARPPEELYTAFRGRMPGIGALLRGRGLAA